MNRALWLLWWLRLRGAVRALLHWRGILLIAMAAGLAALYIVPGAFMAEAMSPHFLMPFVALSLMLLILALVWGQEPPIWYFEAAQIDRLFPAPVSRRELLFYRQFNWILSILLFSLPSAFWFSQALHGFWPAFLTLSILGLILLSLLQLIAQILLLVRQWNLAAWRTVVTAALLLLCAVLWEIVAAFRPLHILEMLFDGNIHELAAILRDTVSATILLLPLAPVDLMIAAASPFSFLAGLISGMATSAAFFGIALWLDQDFRMPGYQKNRKRELVLKTFLQGNAIVGAAPKRASRQNIPFPFWSGFGPVAWCELIQQRTQTNRFVAIVFCYLLLIGAAHHYLGPAIESTLFTVLIVWPFMTASAAGIGKSANAYRALPVPWIALASALVFPAALRDALFTGGFVIATGFVIGKPMLLLLVASFLLPANILIQAMSRAYTLFFQPWERNDPVRTIWHVLIKMALEMLVLLAAVAICFAFFSTVKLLTDSPGLLWFVTWIVAFILSLGFVAILALSLRDPR